MKKNSKKNSSKKRKYNIDPNFRNMRLLIGVLLLSFLAKIIPVVWEANLESLTFIDLYDDWYVNQFHLIFPIALTTLIIIGFLTITYIYYELFNFADLKNQHVFNDNVEIADETYRQVLLFIKLSMLINLFVMGIVTSVFIFKLNISIIGIILTIIVVLVLYKIDKNIYKELLDYYSIVRFIFMVIVLTFFIIMVNTTLLSAETSIHGEVKYIDSSNPYIQVIANQPLDNLYLYIDDFKYEFEEDDFVDIGMSKSISDNSYLRTSINSIMRKTSNITSIFSKNKISHLLIINIDESHLDKNFKGNVNITIVDKNKSDEVKIYINNYMIKNKNKIEFIYDKLIF